MKWRFIHIFFLILTLSSCYSIRKSSGGGQHVKSNQRIIDTSDIALPPGYKIEVVADGLTFPTGITFDENSTPYITESGYSYGEVFTEPRLIRINNGGKKEIIATGQKNGPWTGLWYNNGFFYIAEGGEIQGGKILRIDRSGNSTALIEGLPSKGDHHTNGPVVHKGYIYFGQGTATNSSVVGEDNYKFGWLKRNPEFHDIPCKDVVLVGENFTTTDILEQGSKEKISTGAYLPFGTSSRSGQVISGQIPCSGAVMRIPLTGGTPELLAWGFRNPFGLAFDSDDQFYITDNGYDDRGSRPIWGTGDYLWKLEQGKWYGWPDYSGGHSLFSGNLKVPGEGKPVKILSEIPGTPPQPVAVLGVHSASNGFDFSSSKEFGFKGEAFIAQFGDMAPNVGKVSKPVGYKVIRVNTETGVINDFAVNKKKNEPASKLKKGGLERPNAVRFSPDGSSLYIVDFGILRTTNKGSIPIEGSGVIWKISKK